MTAVKEDKSTLYKVDQKFFSIGHEFVLTGSDGQEIVKADQTFSANPKTWVMAHYNLKHLSGTEWKSAKIYRKNFWDFNAYKT